MMFRWYHNWMLLIGLYLLIAGSLDLFSFGKRTISTDPLFLRLSGLLMIVAYGLVWFSRLSVVPFITLLALAIVCLLVAMIRGVTR